MDITPCTLAGNDDTSCVSGDLVSDQIQDLSMKDN